MNKMNNTTIVIELVKGNEMPDERRLRITAENADVIIFDNMSGIEIPQSDIYSIVSSDVVVNKKTIFEMAIKICLTEYITIKDYRNFLYRSAPSGHKVCSNLGLLFAKSSLSNFTFNTDLMREILGIYKENYPREGFIFRVPFEKFIYKYIIDNNTEFFRY